MRILLDSNILARATPGKQGPAAAVRATIRPPHVLITSPFLMTELSRVLRYDRVQALHGLDDTGIEEFLNRLQENSAMVDVVGRTVVGVVASDPDDDPIVATAVVGNVDVLCTLDKHLHQPDVVGYCKARGIRVLSDVDLLGLLRADVGDDPCQ